MPFQLQDLVRFRYTGALAKILTVQSTGIYKVELLDAEDLGEVIVAFEEDLVLSKDFKGVESSKYMKNNQKEVKGPSTEDLFFSKEEQEARRKAALQAPSKKAEQPAKLSQVENSALGQFALEEQSFSPPKIQYQASLEATGLHLALLQMQPQVYTLYLLNDTDASLGYRFELRLGPQQKAAQQSQRTMLPGDFDPVAELSFDDLNQSPTAVVQIQSLKWEKSIKIKAQKLFNAQRPLPLLGVEGPCYELLPADLQTNKQDLRSYTEQLISAPKPSQKPSASAFKVSLEEVANFDKTIDLHIERLLKNYKNHLLPNEILPFQLKKLNLFIEDALKHHAYEIEIIHGLGEGVLKQAVQDLLKKHPHIYSFESPANNPGSTYAKLK